METVSIRELRGESLRDSARRGKPIAITNHRVMVGVVIPVSTAWVEHLIDRNWSRVHQSILEGEQALATGTPMTPGGLPATADAPSGGGQPAEPADSVLDLLTAPVAAAMVGGAVVHTPHSRDVIEQWRVALNPRQPAAVAETGPAEPLTRTVRIGDLTARLIEQAGAAGQPLAITHDRELIGIIIPVTQGLVQFLIEQTVSRVMYNIRLGEKQLATTDRLVTLDQPASQDAAEDSRR